MDDMLLPAIQARYACRRFLPDPLAPEDAASIVEAGRLAPSGFGLEPWRFVVVEDAAKPLVAEACFDQPPAVTAAALIVIVALVAQLDPRSDYVRVRFDAEARGGASEPVYDAYRAFYRPDSISAWAIGQCNFAAAHMLLQAAHLGLASCPIGGFDSSMLARTLLLPDGEVPALILAFGHCAHAAPERLRKPLG